MVVITAVSGDQNLMWLQSPMCEKLTNVTDVLMILRTWRGSHPLFLFPLCFIGLSMMNRGAIIYQRPTGLTAALEVGVERCFPR